MVRILRYVLGLLGLFVGLQVLLRLVRRLHPFPIPPVATFILEAPFRERTQPRRESLARIGVRPGMRVLEVGTGPGYFTVEAARMLGPSGRLAAVDIEPRMIARVKEKVRRAGLVNVDARVADAADLPYPDASFDLAFLVTVLGEIPDKRGSLAEFRRVLKPGGRLSVTEVLPDPDYLLRTEVINMARRAGFELEERHGSFFCHTLNFRPAAKA